MPFGLREHIRLHAPCLDVNCIQAMQTNGERNWLYKKRKVVDCVSNIRASVKRSMHWGGRGAVIRRDVAIYVDIAFICCAEEENYASHLALIVRIIRGYLMLLRLLID